MCELLVKAISVTHPDPDTDSAGCYKKGDIVVVMPDGHGWGAKEGLPAFILVKIPGLDETTVANYRDSWDRLLSASVVGTDGTVDGARYAISANLPGALNEYGITKSQVQNWMDKWNATFVGATTNEVRFDITIADIYTSEGFWGIDPIAGGITFNETDYTRATGEHIVDIDISGSSWTMNQVRNNIQRSGTTINSEGINTFNVTFMRDDVRSYFIDTGKQLLHKINKRRRYAFSEADVDTVIASGGEVTLTTGQLATKLIDKTT